MGDVDGALAEISSASFRDSYDEFASKKCIELGARLLHLQDLIKRAERDVEGRAAFERDPSAKQAVANARRRDDDEIPW